MRVIDGSTRHDAHAELNTRPACCCVVCMCPALFGLLWTLLIPLECVRDACVEFQAAGARRNPPRFAASTSRPLEAAPVLRSARLSRRSDACGGSIGEGSRDSSPARGAGLSYDGDMITTTVGLRDLLAEVNDATKLLQRSTTVPEHVIELIDSFESALGAATPSRLEADPYLTAALWSAAYRAQKALRHDGVADQRRDVRIALEQFQRCGASSKTALQRWRCGARRAPRTVETVAAPQKTLAELLGVSVRQLQRWLAQDGPEPAADHQRVSPRSGSW